MEILLKNLYIDEVYGLAKARYVRNFQVLTFDLLRLEQTA